MVYASAVLGLTQTLELCLNKNLDGLTALLGCSLCMPRPSLAEEQQLASLPAQQRQLLCQSLWHAVNWLREVVNAFSGDKSG